MKWGRYEDLAVALGSVIRAQRIALGLSQEAVAHEAGLSVRHYAKVEKGTENATLKTLVEIGRVLEMDFLTLVERASEIKTPRKR